MVLDEVPLLPLPGRHRGRSGRMEGLQVLLRAKDRPNQRGIHRCPFKVNRRPS